MHTTPARPHLTLTRASALTTRAAAALNAALPWLVPLLLISAAAAAVALYLTGSGPEPLTALPAPAPTAPAECLMFCTPAAEAPPLPDCVMFCGDGDGEPSAAITLAAAVVTGFGAV